MKVATGWVVMGIAAGLLGAGCEGSQETLGVGTSDTAGVDATLEAASPTIDAKAAVGQKLFFDTALSEPAGQACATCHDPAHGYADGRPTTTSEGSIAGRFGVRNSPAIAYSSYTPALSASGDENGYSGGFFWDGRALTLQVQAGGPLLNPLEMNNPSKAAVIAKVKGSSYAAQFAKVFGKSSLNDSEKAFGYLVDAIASFETASIANRFTSKYDAFLAGKATLSDAEARGLAIFENPAKGNCANCHVDKPDAKGNPPLFTDFGYDNLGIPRNTSNPFYSLPKELNPGGPNYIDNGLGGSGIRNPRQFGKFKAPSLRNIALTAPYGHNGYFPDLHSIVDFYNTRDIPGHWAAPEVPYNMNTTGMGNIGLSAQEEDDLVAFMLTLTDGYQPGAAN